MCTLNTWRRAWQPTPVFLPGESHGQRSLAVCKPQGQHRVGHNRSNLAHMHTCTLNKMGNTVHS